MEEDVDDVLDWLESIETLVDVLFLRWSCQDHVRHEMTLFFSNALSLDILPLFCISRYFLFTFVPSV